MSITMFDYWVPSGKLSHNYGKIHHFSSVNQLFRLGHVQVRKLLNYQRVFHGNPKITWNNMEESLKITWMITTGTPMTCPKPSDE